MCSACAGPANAQVMLEYNPSSILCDYMYIHVYIYMYIVCVHVYTDACMI